MKAVAALLAALGSALAEPVSIPLQGHPATHHLAKRAAPEWNEAPVAAWGADVAYSIPVVFGTPPQMLDLFLNSALINTYVLENTCTTCDGYRTFQVNKSATWLAADFNPIAGSGDVGTDRVGIWLSNQSMAYTVGLVNTTVRANLPRGFVLPPNTTISGNLGLGPTPANASRQNPFLYNLAQNWTEQVYGIQLHRTRPTTNETAFTSRQVPGGMLTLAGVDHKALASEITYLPIADVSHSFAVWAVPLDGINIAGHPVRAVQTQPLVVFPDIVGQAIVGTHAVVGELYSHIPGALLLRNGINISEWTAKAWVFPADAIGITKDTNGTNPTSSIGLEIVIGGKPYRIADTDLVIKLVTPRELVIAYGATPTQAAAAPVWAIGGVQELEPWPRGLPIGFGLGVNFLRNVYTAFKFNPESVGFGYLTPEAGGPVVVGTTGIRTVIATATDSAAPSASTGHAGSGAVRRSSGVCFTLFAVVLAVVWAS
ncbi:hypothetical protein Q8F55_003434 [Vanrija albida]|uniref:Peptidase A1 domain-containing protein n=1 Tax=Vanrija albida TaxID=181172 RepID=A0ABR3Q3Z9_9TREE